MCFVRTQRTGDNESRLLFWIEVAPSCCFADHSKLSPSTKRTPMWLCNHCLVYSLLLTDPENNPSRLSLSNEKHWINTAKHCSCNKCCLDCEGQLYRRQIQQCAAQFRNLRNSIPHDTRIFTRDLFYLTSNSTGNSITLLCIDIFWWVSFVCNSCHKFQKWT